MTNLLSQKAVLAGVSISGWSARKLDRKVTEETNQRHNAKQDAGRFNKLLVDKAHLDPIATIAGAARQDHYRLTQPWFDDGARILPTALYVEYAKVMGKHRTDYAEACDAFTTKYPTMVEAAKARLGSMFQAGDYPAHDSVRSMFDFDLKILPCPDAADFRVDLASEHADDIRADIEARMKEALDDAMKEPVRRIIDTVGKMAERLRAYKPGTNGHRTEGLFRDSLVENVRDLVTLLPAFNLTGDKALDKIAERMASELTKHSADTLRESKRYREETAASAESILSAAQQFMA